MVEATRDLSMMNDDLIFADEDEEFVGECEVAWKLLIVDDDPEVHEVTQLALSEFEFAGRSLEFLKAYSARDAKQILRSHPDIALVLLDVIMETDEAGLEIVKYIREELENRRVRIVLRTGQPGQVPENEVIRHYEIDDYRTKTELTQQRLLTTVITALRSFDLIEKTFNSKQQLEVEVEQRQQAEAQLRQSEARERARAEELKQAIDDLKRAQARLIQTEKMSSLGQMVGGIAHEINNPINFIYGNLSHAKEYYQDLLELVAAYRQTYPNSTTEIEEMLAEIDFEFIAEDCQHLLNSMKGGADRIRHLVESLRNFSGLGHADIKPVDLHEGIESTLLILQSRLKERSDRPAIQIRKQYSDLPPVECYPSQLNQVFINVLGNAIDAIDKQYRETQGRSQAPTLWIETSLEPGDRVAIRIRDNGSGIPPEAAERLFEPFYTTKPIGKGTGLGLSISYHIVVETHGGELKCTQTSPEGSEFAISIPLQPPRTRS